MDTTPDVELDLDHQEISLSYDDTVEYSEQVDTNSVDVPALGSASLAERIGANKVYLISDAVALAARVGKRKHEVENLNDAEEDMNEDIEDTTIRDNAILFQGTPISHLSTSSIFAYATHFDSHPIALEWIDDKTCILVFSSRHAAREAYRYLSKFTGEEPSGDGTVTAKPIPMDLWPPEDRINKSLGTGEGLKGVIRLRWATSGDIKSKGSWEQSEFYKKHGSKAGKPGETEERARKRQKAMEEGDRWEKGNLDEELDSLQADYPPKPVRSRRRVDKTLLERTSLLRSHPVSLESRITAPLPRRARRNARGSPSEEPDQEVGGHKPSLQDRLGGPTPERQSRGEERRTGRRPRQTQEELDAELDAFLNAED